MALKDPPAFNKGALLAVAWILWFIGGATYAATTVGIPTFLNNMPTDLKLAALAWLLVSTGLLYAAIVFLIRGVFGKRNPPN